MSFLDDALVLSSAAIFLWYKRAIREERRNTKIDPEMANILGKGIRRVEDPLFYFRRV